MAPAFTATSAPRDKAGKTLQLKDWTLKNYIDVAHELKWITTTAKDIGEVMRDFGTTSTLRRSYHTGSRWSNPMLKCFGKSPKR